LCLLARDGDQRYFGDDKPTQTRHDILNAFLPYVEQQRKADIYLKHMTRHILGLFHAEPGAKAWRRYLSEHMHDQHAGAETLKAALTKINKS